MVPSKDDFTIKITCDCEEVDKAIDKLSQLSEKLKEVIAGVPTVELVDELKRREGVKTYIAHPYAEFVAVKANGPATVLVVTD